MEKILLILVPGHTYLYIILFENTYIFIICHTKWKLKDQHGKLYYRYNYSDVYKIITVSGHGHYSSVTELLPAYKSNIHISQAKHHDLVKLCNQMVIPAEVHNWYHCTSARAVDTLPQPSIEDSGNNVDDALI